MTQEEICAQLKEKFGEAVGALSETKGDRFVVVKGEKIVEICRFLKGTAGLQFDYCQDITAVDWPARKVIEVVYHLYSLARRHGVVLKVESDRDKPAVATVEGVWKAASWLEREVYDLFGVEFIGHSDLRRIMLPDDWVGHPLRKDYQEAGGYHGIENVRPNPLVQLTKRTEEKRKEIAATAAVVVPAAAPEAKPEAAAALPSGASGPTPPRPAPLASLAPSTAPAAAPAPAPAAAPATIAPASASAPSPSPPAPSSVPEKKE
ncbi:MAG: NADH-quinone oxidoreductase subunit C [Deltaproteobacteria bacterium]|nr:NADH-quinone oxidoreductase subunit C [Deltaproteobacteria bacterium]